MALTPRRANTPDATRRGNNEEGKSAHSGSSAHEERGDERFACLGGFQEEKGGQLCHSRRPGG